MNHAYESLLQFLKNYTFKKIKPEELFFLAISFIGCLWFTPVCSYRLQWPNLASTSKMLLGCCAFTWAVIVSAMGFVLSRSTIAWVTLRQRETLHILVQTALAIQGSSRVTSLLIPHWLPAQVQRNTAEFVSSSEGQWFDPQTNHTVNLCNLDVFMPRCSDLYRECCDGSRPRWDGHRCLWPGWEPLIHQGRQSHSRYHNLYRLIGALSPYNFNFNSVFT